MAPQHDEIVKQLDNGMLIAWDTTKVDRRRLKEVRILADEQAARLGEIIGEPTTASCQPAAAKVK